MHANSPVPHGGDWLFMILSFVPHRAVSVPADPQPVR
jgi:hypothetical protein